MRRVVLIVNPYSTEVTRQRVGEVTAALARHAEVVVRQTERRGHATELAAEAVGEANALVVFSGDGTYNEAINGAAGKLPFGFIPGGGASVFPRALGLPRDPVAAAERAGTALEAGRISSISLGRVNGRRFCFSAGIGFDAEAVRRIDRRGRDGDGRRAGNAIFAATVIGVIVENGFRLKPTLSIEGYGRAASLLVNNGRPYTYAGPVAVTVAGGAEFEAGLDFVAAREVKPAWIPGLAFRGFRGKLAHDSRVLTGHNLDSFEVSCDKPMPLQADGEDLGDVTEASFEAERDALQILR